MARTMRASEQFDLYEAALSSLYDAPTAPDAWAQFMSTFARLVDARGGHYHLWDATRSCMRFSVMTGQYPAAAILDGDERPAAVDPRRRFVGSAAPGEWVFDGEAVDECVIPRSAARRRRSVRDVPHAAAVRLADRGGMLSALGLFRAAGQVPFGAVERPWLDRVTPHVQRASRLHLRFEALRLQAALGWQAADSLDYPILIVDAQERILFANRAADCLFAMPRGPIVSSHGRIAASMGKQQAMLTTSIRRACAATGRRGDFLLLRHDANDPAYQVVVVPLRSKLGGHGLEEQPLALVTLGVCGVGSSVDGEFLHQVFGLSAAEARVVEGLAAGLSVALMAREAGVSVNTVRTQLHAAFAKTGTHRQSELIQLVSALPRVRR